MSPDQRSFLVGYPLIAATGIGVLLLHVVWLSRTDHQSEVILAIGPALAVFGIWLASRPYVRLGIEGLIQASLPRDEAGCVVDDNYPQEFAALQAATRPGVTRDVLG